MTDYAYWEREREEGPTDCGPRRVEEHDLPELEDGDVDLGPPSAWHRSGNLHTARRTNAPHPSRTQRATLALVDDCPEIAVKASARGPT